MPGDVQGVSKRLPETLGVLMRVSQADKNVLHIKTGSKCTCSVKNTWVLSFNLT